MVQMQLIRILLRYYMWIMYLRYTHLIKIGIIDECVIRNNGPQETGFFFFFLFPYVHGLAVKVCASDLPQKQKMLPLEAWRNLSEFWTRKIGEDKPVSRGKKKRKIIFIWILNQKLVIQPTKAQGNILLQKTAWRHGNQFENHVGIDWF